ncbi:MAG: mechanosensitive ion channel family protein [Pseudomonadota bacterium]|nr:mechanosensitive ion channel family protein [Pseudomonadota bacterium]
MLLAVAMAMAPESLLAQEAAAPDKVSVGENAPRGTTATPTSEMVDEEIRRGEADDARIAARVVGRLARQESLGGVSTQVKAGTVILTGTVPAEVDRELAESIAAEVPGVAAVDDEIALSTSLRDRLEPALEQVREKFMRLLASLPLLLLAIALVVVFAWIGRALADRLHLVRLGSRNPYLDSLIRQVVRLALLLIGVLIALDLIGATALVGAVLGSAGVLGIMLGFAFRDLAENYLAGVMLSLRRPFEPGDHIVVDGNEGKVMSLNSRATVLMTLDGNHLRLPNAMVFKSVLLNYTRNPMRRLQFSLGIGTGEDLAEARRIGMDAMRQMSAIAAEPPPNAVIQSVGDSAVQMDFFAWVDQRDVDFLKTRSETIRQVKLAIEAAGMDMPEPIYRVQLRNQPAPAAVKQEEATKEQARKRQQAQQGETADVSVDHNLDAQIARERAEQEGTDLLQHPAPKE